MSILSYTLDDNPNSGPLGLIVLKADLTLEREARHWIGDPSVPLHISRIMSGEEVTPETLGAMEADLKGAAELLPDITFSVVGYGCTSASALLGADTVSSLIGEGCNTRHVTDPMTALVVSARTLGVSRLALVSPYIEPVNEPLRSALAKHGLSTEVFGTFDTAREADVARIATASIVEAGIKLGRLSEVDAVFLSCTNLPTRAAIPEIEAAIRKPVLSSNSALFHHMTLLRAQMPSLSVDSTS